MKTPTIRTAHALSARSTLATLAALSLLGVLLLGCDKKDSQRSSDEETSASDAGATKASKVADEPDLARAVASVAAAHPMTGGSVAGGPPPSGIFDPGEADKAAAKGSAPTLTIGSEGAEPRVLLGPSPKPGTKRSGTVALAMQNDPQQPPIEFAITLEATKPKAEGEAAAPPGTQVVVKVTGAKINAPNIPPEVTTALSKLRGSRVEYRAGADGSASNAHAEIAKGVDPGFKESLQGLSDLLIAVALPFPNKPVGVGAYWMVTGRDVLLGIDVVSYRLVKVEKVEAGVATLSLNIKRYAASPAFELEGLPPDAPRVMSEFRAISEGKLTVAAGDAVPTSAEIQSIFGAALGAPDPSVKQRPTMQVQSRASLSLTP